MCIEKRKTVKGSRNEGMLERRSEGGRERGYRAGKNIPLHTTEQTSGVSETLI